MFTLTQKCSLIRRYLKHARLVFSIFVCAASTTEASKTIAAAIVGSRLDFYNSLLAGTSVYKPDSFPACPRTLLREWLHKILGSATSVVPNLFCSTGHLFYFGRHGGHKVKFFTSPSPPLPFLPTARGSGECCKLPQWGLGRSPSRQRILEHSMTKSDRFDMLQPIFQRSKQHKIFRFSPRISYFHHNWHNGSYFIGLPCQNKKFYSFCTYIFKIL